MGFAFHLPWIRKSFVLLSGSPLRTELGMTLLFVFVAACNSEMTVHQDAMEASQMHFELSLATNAVRL